MEKNQQVLTQTQKHNDEFSLAFNEQLENLKAGLQAKITSTNANMLKKFDDQVGLRPLRSAASPDEAGAEIAAAFSTGLSQDRVPQDLVDPSAIPSTPRFWRRQV